VADAIPTFRERYTADLYRWLLDAPEKRRPELAACAAKCGIAGGRPWSQFTDAEIAQLHRAVFTGNFQSDAEFDLGIPF